MQFQKISILPPQKRLEFPGGVGGSMRQKTFKEMYETKLEFPEGWEVLEKNPFGEGGMDILWNYPVHILIKMDVSSLITLEWGES